MAGERPSCNYELGCTAPIKLRPRARGCPSTFYSSERVDQAREGGTYWDDGKHNTILSQKPIATHAF